MFARETGPVLSLPAPHSLVLLVVWLVEARGTVAFTAHALLTSLLALCGSGEGQQSSGGAGGH